jgi:hypothetical protein
MEGITIQHITTTLAGTIIAPTTIAPTIITFIILGIIGGTIGGVGIDRFKAIIDSLRKIGPPSWDLVQ